MGKVLSFASFQDPQDISAAGIRAFSNIAERWSLTAEQQIRLLGLESRSTLYTWKSKARAGRRMQLRRDTLERISYVLGIFKAINILLPITERADRWVHAPNANPLFGGGSALDRMTSGKVSDLYVVRRMLDAELNSGA